MKRYRVTIKFTRINPSNKLKENSERQWEPVSAESISDAKEICLERLMKHEAKNSVKVKSSTAKEMK